MVIGCLIVRVVDHKSLSAQPSSSSSSSSGEKNAPFSVHNYNQHVTPSPYIPYPQQNQSGPKGTDLKVPLSDQPPGPQPTSENAPAASKGKEPKVEIDADAMQKRPLPKPRVFTTVLHPTPQSLQAELTIWSMTPDPKAMNRRQSHAYAASRTPGSATLPHPPTPLSVLPSSPVTERAPPAKRQKMMVESQDLLEVEAKLTRAMAPPLYLE